KARDAYCAKRDGVSPREFSERHVRAIQRGLEVFGMHAGADIERVYRGYLANGSLLIEAKPYGTVRRADYGQYAAADLQRMYNAKISSDGIAPVPLVLETVPARPVPAGFKGGAWDLIALEDAAPAIVSEDIPAAAASVGG